jgi:hypothetical protein
MAGAISAMPRQIAQTWPAQDKTASRQSLARDFRAIMRNA